jgi:hypothetical protein
VNGYSSEPFNALLRAMQTGGSAKIRLYGIEFAEYVRQIRRVDVFDAMSAVTLEYGIDYLWPDFRADDGS